MLLGPTILIMLRFYLQIYVEHSNRLERLGRSMLTVRAPTLVPLRNPLIEGIGVFTFYGVLPITMLLFAEKAAVFPAWGSGLLCAAVGIIAGHAVLPLGKVSWRSKALLSVSAAIIAGGVMFGFRPLHRSFDLYHADLSNQWLGNDNLSGADLSYAKLSGANLSYANLNAASLSYANLSNAELIAADLSNAFLGWAKLSGANLHYANLSGAKLISAQLNGADLSVANLNGADLVNTKLTGADLNHADLSNANLDGADLRHADLSRADLNHADLSNANLSHADLSGAKLRDASLTQARELNEACGDVYTRLPADFTVKLCSAER
jgi:uncharacterized protein YjbI with pentapeptide repeats